MSALALGFGAIVVPTLFAAAAEAGEIVRQCNVASCDPYVSFTADEGERNNIDARFGVRQLWVADLDNILRLGEVDGPDGNGCRRPEDGEFRQVGTPSTPRNRIAVCRWGDDAQINFRLRDGNDRVATPAHGFLYGGAGNDFLAGRGTLDGGPGNDDLLGGGERDILRGGDGDDDLDAGRGPDDLHGGSGFDTARWEQNARQRRGLHITVGDGAANDGERCDRFDLCDGRAYGRGDEVFGDVEKIVGGADDDVIIGDQSGEVLVGLGGNDRLRGGDGPDRLWGGGFVASPSGPVGFGGVNDLAGGDGDDLIIGGFGPDAIAGNAGNDDLRGDQQGTSEGTDSLSGGSGNDLLDGGDRAFRANGDPSADFLVGGDGVDTADYSAREGALRISLDNAENDGAFEKAPGEQDNVASDVENILGGSGDDLLIGNARDNDLWGRGGADTLIGRTGADLFRGGVGTDDVSYAERTGAVTANLDGQYNDGVTYDVEGVPTSEGDNIGVDVEGIIGGSGNDNLGNDLVAKIVAWLRGGPGNDVLRGGNHFDTLDGDDGDDQLFSWDGNPDTVNGGKGEDTAQLDEYDTHTGIEIFLPADPEPEP